MARFEFPTPPSWLRRGPLREGAFRSSLHDERTAALLGTALGVAFATAFLTGLISHELQLRHPPSWIPDRPVWIYRFTQGLHVASGLAAVPLLLAKLWTVYPRLFTWPPLSSLRHGLERLSILVLVAGAVFQLVTGLLNVIQWYPWAFAFVPTHYQVAWITVGALIVHIAVKAPAIARGYRRSAVPAASTVSTAVPAEPAASVVPAVQPEAASTRPGTVSRRSLLTATGAAVGVVTLTTVGQSVTSLRGLDLLAPRDPSVGPQGVPINRTAAQAGVLTSAHDPAWRLEVAGPRPFRLSLAQLGALPQCEAALPIACVEGWSVNGRWAGVRLRDLLDRAGAAPGADIRIVSLERSGFYATTTMPREYARDPLTLLALRLGGLPLSVDHGYPARIIAPGRPGVLQTKWVQRIEVL
ncbi:molybdopterin-dependent oxidoreductase [Actinocrinis puniceicyclus]|uniref:Molybdopterin-dependent oxidoreductase n=1 Tax=Actinocrinis puniceicyclus TaxID=977794 RepID=A0A8J7WKZ1_9ACTN|nr:molybdopterin-dependent oxidoreductase [Actinocrinis puniceicyclus]MBS2963228.1 molybdopterin-dependent oxidoreductase [Actinocrinis puniceicyclus]